MIQATTHRSWELVDGVGRHTRYTLPPGTYQLERIACPLGHRCNWLVIAGTVIGMAEGAWQDWRNGTLNGAGEPIDWGEFAIDIVEKPGLALRAERATS